MTAAELIQAQRELRARLLADPHRPLWHFVAPEGWCMPFDPNGALYWEGRYHLCTIFQDERGHCWGHASSADLLHWRWHPPALAPEPGDVDRGIFSGNAFVNLAGQPTLLYHGVGAGNCLAHSSDHWLETWTKAPHNPIVPIPAPDSPAAALYRSWDPHGWTQDGRYRAIFGGQPATVFAARELDQWQYVGPLLTTEAAEVDDFEDLSCPDLFQLGDRHVLLAISHARGCRAYVGDWIDDAFVPRAHHRMNWPGGVCFAPESLQDPTGRRIFWAWVLEQRPPDEALWGGTLSLPRVLELGPGDTLRISPAVELQQLRRWIDAQGDRVAVGATPLPRVRGDSLELSLRYRPHGAGRYGLRLRATPDGAEQTDLWYDHAAGTLTCDVARASLAASPYRTFVMREQDNHPVTAQVAPFKLAPGEELTLRVFLDRSLLEVFANHRQCLTQRLYPTRPDALEVALLAEQSEVSVDWTAWEMAPTNAW
ncbi:MAG: glycoside hydrolase family 32 protein [Fimbriimonadaceae bacterium]|nr:glycoside hydrolase family 32 protein [Fimbriimonadaceae bacterium]